MQQNSPSCSQDTLIVIVLKLQQCSPLNSFNIYLLSFPRSACPFMRIWKDSQANTNKQQAQVIHPLMPFMKFIAGIQRSQDIQVSSQHFKHFFSFFKQLYFWNWNVLPDFWEDSATTKAGSISQGSPAADDSSYTFIATWGPEERQHWILSCKDDEAEFFRSCLKWVWGTKEFQRFGKY